MIDITPSPIAFSIFGIEVHWYGIAYVAAIVAAYFVVTRMATRRGLNASLVADGIIVIAIAALIGGRMYHVIDQWQLYKDDLLKIVQPPYSGLGVYGGLATGAVALVAYARYKRQPFWRWGDVVVLGILAAQVVGRWGNFANQELYGPQTNLPWGIAIQCSHRVAEFACPPGSDPNATLGQHFHPLFLYESLLSLLGLIVLSQVLLRFVGPGRRLMVGDVGMLYFAWYGTERALLETFRSGYNWTFFGIPTAQVVGLGAALIALAVIVVRHRFRNPEREAEAEAKFSGSSEADQPDTARQSQTLGEPATDRTAD